MGQRVLKQRLIQVGNAENVTKIAHRPTPDEPRSEDLTTLAARAVLATLGAGVVRLHLRVARRVGAVDQSGGGGLPRRPPVPGVAARHLPLRDCHGYSLLDSWGRS